MKSNCCDAPISEDGFCQDCFEHAEEVEENSVCGYCGDEATPIQIRIENHEFDHIEKQA